jgi:protein-disulfide isomerase
LSKKAWIIFAAICVVVLGGLIYLSGKNKVEVNNIDTNKIQPAVPQSGQIADHVFGKADSKVMLVEYGDFQCPGCGSAYPIIKAVSEKYKDQLAFVFRNFPLTAAHPNARAAAATAEAAGLQGKYWEMHNMLYENQNTWKSITDKERAGFFEGYATTLGMNVDTFKVDYAGKNVNQKISFDQALGRKLKVSGTPTFYLNGKEVDQYVKDGKIVSKDTEGADPIWGNQDAFEKLLLIPAFKEQGIALPKAE